MIKVIIFDLAEVYLKGFCGVETYLADFLNLKVSKINRSMQGSEFKLFMKNIITEEEFLDRILSRNNWNIQIIDFKIIIRKNFEEIKGTREIIENLKEKGYKLGLLSDHSKEWVNYCNKKFDYHKLFDYIQYSFEVGCCKTDKKTFELLFEKLDE